ncbi:hypothetical protein [Mycoplasma sp. P36-A1]|uniref:hypothetical protein n=1 Tax=Mycoplasma sp. P36-A1 TaxID=3252900 RepID=UPI003C300BB6
MDNNQQAKILNERLLLINKLFEDAEIFSQRVTNKNIQIGLSIQNSEYEYDLTSNEVKRKIKSNVLNYEVLKDLEKFIEELRIRLYAEDIDQSQISLTDLGIYEDLY